MDDRDAEVSLTQNNLPMKKKTRRASLDEPEAKPSVPTSRIAEDTNQPIKPTGPHYFRLQRPTLWKKNPVKRPASKVGVRVDLSVLSPESISKCKNAFFGKDDPRIGITHLNKHFLTIPIVDPIGVLATFIRKVEREKQKDGSSTP